MRLPKHDRGLWTVLLLLLIGVLTPTACVLWFMNVAIQNQRDAARQRLAEAYHGQLALVRDRVESYWERRAIDLETAVDRSPAPAVFAEVVRKDLADSVIVLRGDGTAAYPSIAIGVSSDAERARPEWNAAQALESRPELAAAAYGAIAKTEPDVSLAARAAQAQIRCLVQTGDNGAAIRAIQEHFSGGRLMRGYDPSGRLIAADEQLLAVRLKGAGDKLQALLEDYTTIPIPSMQRLFLMEEARTLGLGPFPAYEAERLAAAFLETGQIRAGNSALEASGVPDVWKLTSSGGRAIALYRTARILSDLANSAFDLAPPTAAPPRSDATMPAGPRMPGWHITLDSDKTQPFDEISRRQMQSYVWIGLLAIAAVAIAAVLAGQALRRQWSLAHLKTDLVAAVSHELKTPLASMRLLLDSLLDDAAPDSQKTRDYLEMIARENLRLSRLIENFLTFSRLERNRQKFDLTVTEPAAVIATVRERFQSPDCALEVRVATGLPQVRADEGALVSVLLNLLDNAYKYTPGEKHIGLKVFLRGDAVVFAVEDNGIGIPLREQKKIFRRFYQVDRRLAREAGGCGLGLSIVEYIVKAHGGTVDVKSDPGRGSTFSVALPSAATTRGAA